MIIWKKAQHRSALWIGSTGTESFEQREAFYLRKIKPDLKMSARQVKWFKVEWHYEYALLARAGVTVERVGTAPFKSFEEAKQAAESFAASRKS